MDESIRQIIQTYFYGHFHYHVYFVFEKVFNWHVPQHCDPHYIWYYIFVAYWMDSIDMLLRNLFCCSVFIYAISKQVFDRCDSCENGYIWHHFLTTVLMEPQWVSCVLIYLNEQIFNWITSDFFVFCMTENEHLQTARDSQFYPLEVFQKVNSGSH